MPDTPRAGALYYYNEQWFVMFSTIAGVEIFHNPASNQWSTAEVIAQHCAPLLPPRAGLSDAEVWAALATLPGAAEVTHNDTQIISLAEALTDGEGGEPLRFIMVPLKAGLITICNFRMSSYYHPGRTDPAEWNTYEEENTGGLSFNHLEDGESDIANCRALRQWLQQAGGDTEAVR